MEKSIIYVTAVSTNVQPALTQITEILGRPFKVNIFTEENLLYSWFET